jgi:H+-transporting ATPase
MAQPNHLKFDLENSQPDRLEGSEETAHDGNFNAPTGNDEYSTLVRYISTYRDGRRQSTISLGSKGGNEDKKVPAWKFWKRGKPSSGGPENDTFEPPEDWFNTDMRQGLSESEVEQRRKKTGYNELTTEKENLFLKFLGFFQGPILYGMSTCSHFELIITY